MLTAEGELYVGSRRAIKSKEEARQLFIEFHSSPMGGTYGHPENLHSNILQILLVWHVSGH